MYDDINTMLALQMLLLMMVVVPIETYSNMCPYKSHRTFRSQCICLGTPKNYSCLFDTNRKEFVEYCNIPPDFSAPGEYYVVTGNRRNIECRNTTYQPFSLWSNESSRCIFHKSVCTESGQILYKLGSATDDSRCRCDYTKHFAFLIPPTNRCFCIPSEEDCSCYIKQCGIGYILNADYKCTLRSQRSETKYEDIENLGINTEKEIQIENTSDITTALKSDRNVILATFITLLVLILLPVLCMLLLVNICNGICGHGNKQTVNQSDFMVVAAIDIGTAFSGYASSTRKVFDKNPFEIKKNTRWLSVNYNSLKTDTCILMKQGNYVALGQEAKDEYDALVRIDQAEDYLFFNEFKMELYNNQNISNEMVIKDVKDKEMKAIDVFSTYIHELMKRVKNDYQEIEFEDIQWVFTVPVVWSFKAIHFMKQCAEKIGVRHDRLVIATDTEAVSVYFQYLHDFEPTDLPELDKRYVVVDIGRGTVDITAHEKTDDKCLMELCKSTGDDIGEKEVDKSFFDWFSELFGKDVINSLLTEDKYKDSYSDILKEIENFKRRVFLSPNDKLSFKVPFSDLDSLCKQYYDKSLNEKIALSTHAAELCLKKENIIFNRSSLTFLFKPVEKRIVDKLTQVLNELKDYQINMILLVGGCSKSPVIVKTIENTFKSMKIVTIPKKYPADLGILLGAVIYGHRPDFITSRITKYTYGRLVQIPFESSKHKPSKRITLNGIDLCNDVFEVLVKKNARVHVNEKTQKEYKITNSLQKQVRIAVYNTAKDKVDYVDDDGCRLLCDVIVSLDETKSKHSCVIVDFMFGYADFQVKAFEKETGTQYKVELK